MIKIEFMERLIITVWLLFGMYMLVLLAVSSDLWSGLRKAKKKCEIRTSYGLRKTIDKLAKYYNVLIALTIVDAMQIGSIWYLDQFYHYLIPIFPIVTFLGAVGICLIEIKSIYENVGTIKDKEQVGQIGELAGKIAGNRDNTQDVIKAILDYLNSANTKKNE